MLEIMIIEDYFLLPGKGIIISGVNSALDYESKEHIQTLIGECIRVTQAGEDELVFKVKNIGTSESLLGKKTISILLDSFNLALLARGNRVLTK